MFNKSIIAVAVLGAATFSAQAAFNLPYEHSQQQNNQWTAASQKVDKNFEAVKNEFDKINNALNSTPNQYDAQRWDEGITANKDQIAANKGQIAANKGQIAANKDQIKNNTNDIHGLQQQAVENALHDKNQDQNIGVNANNIEKNQQAIAANKDQIAANKDQIKNNTNDIHGLQQQAVENALHDKNQDQNIGVNANNIEKNQQAIAANKDQIAANKDQIKNNTNDIHGLQQQAVENALHDKNQDQNIGVNANNIEKNQQAIAANKDQIAANKDQIKNNTNDIHGLQQQAVENALHDKNQDQNIGVNANNIEKNQQAIAANYKEMKNNFAAVNSRIDDLDEEMKKGFASQAALAGLFQPYNVGKFNLSVALGGYESEQAMALGTGYRFNENFAMKAGIATDVGGFDHLTYNIGANFEW